MQFTKTIYAIVAVMAVTAAANPDAAPEAENLTILEGTNDLFKRKSCSGQRLDTEHCGGKKVGTLNSFHNCKGKKYKGKCCAKNSDGSGEIDVSHGKGSEECGYCFGGKCSG